MVSDVTPSRGRLSGECMSPVCLRKNRFSECTLLQTFSTTLLISSAGYISCYEYNTHKSHTQLSEEEVRCG